MLLVMWREAVLISKWASGFVGGICWVEDVGVVFSIDIVFCIFIFIIFRVQVHIVKVRSWRR